MIMPVPHCADCNKPNPDMHNSREVRVGIWPFRRTERKRHDGYLCTDCWIEANPELNPNRQLAPYQPREDQASLIAVLLIGILALAGIVIIADVLSTVSWYEPRFTVK